MEDRFASLPGEARRKVVIRHRQSLAVVLYTVLLSSLNLAHAQTPPQSLTAIYPPEKVYLHTDRSSYVAGDTIWFSVYHVEGKQHSAKVISKTLYVNLVGEQNNSVATQTIRLDSMGRAAGDMVLPDSLVTGNYQLVAHTNWMRNASEAFFFRKTIQIWSRSVPSIPIDTNHLAGLELRFFPEGGHLVEGQPCRVAFQSVDKKGKAITITGTVVNNKEEVIMDFRSLHQGMGTFTFTPQPGQQYWAKTINGGQNVLIPLPTALPKGYVLAVDNLTSKHSVRVRIQNSHPSEGYLTLFAHLRGQVCFQAPLDAAKHTMLVEIPYDSIRQDGILHITLFDTDHLPVCERLVFVNRNRQLKIRISPDQAVYQPRQAVMLTVNATDSNGKPESTRLSLAVTDLLQVSDAEPKAATLRSYLLLTSDLRGYVDQPEYYFDSTRSQARIYLDYLMMTHGWRRFRWRAILSDSLPKSLFQAEEGLSLQGQLRDSKGNPAKEIALQILLKTSKIVLPIDDKTDRDGYFLVDNLFFTDTATVLIRPKRKRPLTVKLTTQPEAQFAPLPVFFSDQSMNKSWLSNTLEMHALTQRLRRNGGIMLKTVDVKAKRLDASRTDSRRVLYGEADYTLTTTEPMRAMPSVLQMLRGKVAGVSVSVNPDGTGAVMIRNGPGAAAIIVDGMMMDNSVLSSINPNDVEAIDVLMNPATAGVLGVRGGGGAIHILTRRGSSGSPDRPNGTMIKKIMGYAVSREFYSPRYAPPAFQKDIPDYRATLYWNPSVQTDANGKATVTFYNSDNLTTIRAIVEGISSDGQPGYGTMLYPVRK
jgi:hypothetical protein